MSLQLQDIAKRGIRMSQWSRDRFNTFGRGLRYTKVSEGYTLSLAIVWMLSI